MWKYQGWEKEYKERLGVEVFEFLTYDRYLIEYLSDHQYVWKELKPRAREFQLKDNSIFVLLVCKIFEGALKLIAKEAGWFDKFNKGKKPHNIRSFYRSKRKEIEGEIDSLPLSLEEKQDTKDKFFSVVNDFKERHEVMHTGSMLEIGSIDNYDAILTKVREIVSLCLEIKLISIGDVETISSEGSTFYRKK